MATKVGVVILGDEVLKGEIRETNLAHMIPLLAEWGAETALCAILPDDGSVVVRHLRRFREEVDLLVLTGGIGPTPDDITRDAVAEGAGGPRGCARRCWGGGSRWFPAAARAASLSTRRPRNRPTPGS